MILTDGIFKVEEYELGGYDNTKDGEIKWMIEGPSPGSATGEGDLRHRFTSPDSYIIKCFIGEKACKEPLTIEVRLCTKHVDSTFSNQFKIENQYFIKK